MRKLALMSLIAMVGILILPLMAISQGYTESLQSDAILTEEEPAQPAPRDAVHKLGRGLTNVLSSWIEIPKQLHLARNQDNPLKALGVGLIRGVGYMGIRIGVGLYETFTFPIPKPKDFASPYEYMEIPDYPWDF